MPYSSEAVNWMTSTEVSSSNETLNILRPFNHQVGGHAPICKFNDSTICKPLIIAERDFYESLSQHDSLAAFIPHYLGVVNVTGRTIRQVRPGGEEILFASGDNEYSLDTLSTPTLTESGSPYPIDRSSDITIPDVDSSIKSNPWSLHMQKTRKASGNYTSQFVLLEDLTHGLRVPCILDLKMGTQQHGRNASPAKRERQILKCQRTTSATLGVRICGMQVFRVDSQAYYYQDKYYGRQLTPSNFMEGILKFLNNGHEILTHFIPSFINRLKHLYRVIESLPQYRFYGSSLLLIYDGHPSANFVSEVDLRMIDFAHSCRLDQPPENCEPDRGYLLGLRTLINIFEEILKDPTARDLGA